MMAKNSSDELHYNEKGNQVTLVCHHKKEEEYSIPFGFRDEEEIEFKTGDLVFQEGDSSTSLYYILYGEFDIMVKDKKVGHLTPSDMFLGEMSFLLNNKRSATVIAAKPSKVLIIPKKSFIKIIKQYPNYLVLISRLLAHRLARANVQALPYV
jgi:CRP-like cAMP-binding protein